MPTSFPPLRRPDRRAAPLRRHHRLPGAPPRRAAGTGEARHIRLRRLGTPSPPSGAGRGRHRPRPSPARRRPAPSPSSSARPSAGGAADAPPEPLDAAILFAPAGELVPVCLEALEPWRDALHRRDPPERHPFAQLREASVRGADNPERDGEHPPDGEEFLELAARIGIRVTTTPTRSRKRTGRFPISPTQGQRRRRPDDLRGFSIDRAPRRAVAQRPPA